MSFSIFLAVDIEKSVATISTEPLLEIMISASINFLSILTEEMF